MTKQYTKT